VQLGLGALAAADAVERTLDKSERLAEGVLKGARHRA
jgi:hypothetical protein